MDNPTWTDTIYASFTVLGGRGDALLRHMPPYLTWPDLYPANQSPERVVPGLASSAFTVGYSIVP